MIRTALIGCGGRGRGQLRVLSEFDDVELVAVCDPLAEARAQAADEHGIERRYESIEKMLDDGNIDAIFVTTPAHLNASSALPCLQAGVATLLEKPPGLHIEQTHQLREAAEKSGAKAMVGWDRRFHPLIVEARRLVEERGPIVQLVGEFHKGMANLERGGRFPEIMMQRMLLETPIHSIDIVRSLGNSDVAEVHSVVKRRFSKYNDVHAALVLFENGCVAHIIANYTTSARLERYEIHGREISAYLEGVHTAKIVCNEETRELKKGEGSSSHGENRFFIDCVKHDRPIDLPAANLDEAVKTMELCEAILAGLRED
jgi:predicted dehydrogenase